MSEIEEKFTLVCRKCSAPATIETGSSGCNDPECCGGASYSVTVVCTNRECGETAVDY